MTASADRSKKQSALNLPSLPEPLVFFIDRSLGRRVIPNALRDAGARVEVHDDHFSQDAQDQVWLDEAGKRCCVVLTKDKHLRYRAVETNGLMSAKVRAFVLTTRGVERRGNRPDFCQGSAQNEAIVRDGFGTFRGTCK